MTDGSLLPFASGDIFVPMPVLDPAARFPTGAGRVCQLGADFQMKACVETGRTGLISALALAPDGTLLVLDPQARAVDRFGRDGQRMPALALDGRACGSALSLPGGGMVLGEHLAGADGPFQGRGEVVVLDPCDKVLAVYPTEWNGGVGGFLGVTHMALSGDGRTLYHVSETGRHLYAHDLADDRRLGPIYTRDDPPGMLFGLASLPDGRLAVAIGTAVRLLSAEGAHIADVALPSGRGWANLVVRPGGRSLFALDFFGGRVAELSLPDLALMRVVDLANPQGMTSLAEVS